jgi:anaerobic selenocysteine-containing dehydrogenase
MPTEKVVKSGCGLCLANCGVLIHLKDGKPVRVEGDPENPINRGALCVRGKNSLEYAYHPDRLLHPLKRVGEKGKGKWERITWDEALNTISSELNKVKGKYGAESLLFIRGGSLGYQDNYVARFANVFGAPNVASMAYICHQPRVMPSVYTYGFKAYPDYEYPPACIVLWAVNTCATAIGECNKTNEAVEKGSKLVVIDPGETPFAKKADIWLKPRPCSDLALALGMINVIINEELFDKNFVDKWTVGFEELRKHVQDYSPEKVAEITWVPAEKIREVARFYATNKPACIAWGNGIDNNINNFQCARAIAILRALTGNIGIPGGDAEWSPSGIVSTSAPELVQQNALSPEMRAKRISAAEGLLPTIFYALPQNAVKAMLKAEPYPMRAAFLQGGNLLHTYSNAKEVYEAFKSLDFFVVTDHFMTPTAELADIVLPAATYLEIDHLQEGEHARTVNVVQKVTEIGECWSDLKIFNELAKRMGLGKYFWENDEQALDFILKPTGLTFKEFKKIGTITGIKQYRKYEKDGFSTPSGKVELYSNRLKEWGFDPLPVYREPPESPLSAPELAKEFPLVFTSWKLPSYKHAGWRQVKSVRKTHPDPLVVINTETAKKLGIKEGKWVYIETKRGKIKQKATLSPNIDHRVIVLEHGWWYPERKNSEMSDWAESNSNILTDNKKPYAREMGSATLRGILCKVYPAE